MLCVCVKIQAGKQSPLSVCEQRESNTRNWLHRWRKGLKSKKQPRDLQGPEDTTMMSLERQKEQVVVPRSRAGVTQWRLVLWWVEASAKKDIWSMWQKPPETRGGEKPYFSFMPSKLTEAVSRWPWSTQSLLLLLFSHPVMSNSLWPHELQHTRPPCPSPSPRVCPSSCSLHQWCHPAISSFWRRRPLLLLSSIFPSIRDFSNKSSVHIRWPTSRCFSFSITSSSEHSGLISLKTDWFDLLPVHGTFRSLLQHHSSKASILWCPAFFMVQLSQLYMTTGKTKALTLQTFVSRVMFLLFNTLSRFVTTFLPRSSRLLISWLQPPSTVILEPKKKTSVTTSTFSPSVCHAVMGPDAMSLVF